MDKKAKRINYTPDEKNLLAQLVHANKDVVENKTTNAVSNTEKDEAWNRIAIQFNEMNHVHRDESSLRKQWSNIKQDLRKKAAESRRQLYKTGGGPPETKFKDEAMILEVVNTKTISGLDNINDCDALSQPSTNTYEDVADNNAEDRNIQDRLAKRQWAQKRRPVKRNSAVEDAKLEVLQIQAEMLSQEMSNKNKLFQLEYEHKEKMFRLERQLIKKELGLGVLRFFYVHFLI
uniref:Regulatory protein zeste n=1 Tax=Diabrotica virgifera virgifera TaxID=50390 RepID=A0A6P7GWF4_DIAVI